MIAWLILYGRYYTASKIKLQIPSRFAFVTILANFKKGGRFIQAVPLQA
jgi:hypothetical protein